MKISAAPLANTVLFWPAESVKVTPSLVIGVAVAPNTAIPPVLPVVSTVVKTVSVTDKIAGAWPVTLIVVNVFVAPESTNELISAPPLSTNKPSPVVEIDLKVLADKFSVRLFKPAVPV